MKRKALDHSKFGNALIVGILRNFASQERAFRLFPVIFKEEEGDSEIL